MRKVYRNQSEATGETGDGNVQSHSHRSQIKGEAPADFTTTGFDSIEVSEALGGRKAGGVRLHTAFDVSARPHFNMEAQFRLNLARDLSGMTPGVKKSDYGFDP